jgi:peptide/nickel transport system permease protein
MINPDAAGFDLFLSKASNYVLPVTCLTLLSVGAWMRYARTNMLDVLNSDYIRTARAKGLPERQVIYSHAFRNTLVPFVTLVGGSLPALFGGAMITENLFEFPGIGWTGYKALQLGDVPLIMAVNVVLAALTLASTLLADLSYAIVDPRVRLGGPK